MPLSAKEATATMKRALWVAAPLGILILVLATIVWPLWLEHNFHQRLLAQAKGPQDLLRPQLYLYNVSSYVHKDSGSLISFNFSGQFAGNSTVMSLDSGEFVHFYALGEDNIWVDIFMRE